MKTILKSTALLGIILCLFACENVETKEKQEISFGTFSHHAISEGSITLKASASSGLPVTFLSSDTSIATIKDSLLYLIKPGTVTITVTQTGNARYNQAAQVSRTLTIHDDINTNKWDQTITYNSTDSVWKASQGPLKLTAFSSSGLPVKFSSSNSSYASIKGDLLEVESAAMFGNHFGVYVTITASQAGSYVYKEAPTVSHILRVIHDVH